MAVAALAAVVHDILVTVGVYSISRFEVTPATVVAFLTILGYSLYDTIVVFDKVEENAKGLAASGPDDLLRHGEPVDEPGADAVAQHLDRGHPARSCRSWSSAPACSGATTLKDFGLALLVGLLTGAYSSIFIASPILAMLKEREPRYTAIRQRLTPRAAPAADPGGRAGLAGGGGGRRGCRSAGRRRPSAGTASGRPVDDRPTATGDGGRGRAPGPARRPARCRPGRPGGAPPRRPARGRSGTKR